MAASGWSTNCIDVAKQERLLGLAVGGRAKGMRDVAHQIADQIYEKILGVRGAFWTRIAYITASGLGQGTQYALMVADSDGFNPQTIVRSREPLLSPAWSPDGKQARLRELRAWQLDRLHRRKSATGAREVLASFKGINGAPAFSPDGRRLAMTLSKGGNPEIYVMDLASQGPDPAHPSLSASTPKPSGCRMARRSCSPRTGPASRRSIQVAATGGEPSRVSFQGESNARATVSYDGKKIAMAQGSGNIYRISVLDRSFGGTGRWQTLSPGNLDESPSFAPNGSMLLYATKEGRRGVLYAVSADGRVRLRLVTADGDVREPAWSPFRQR